MLRSFALAVVRWTNQSLIRGSDLDRNDLFVSSRQ